MLYRELTRVNELDTKISDLHRLLADLYSERAQLLQGPPAPAKATHPQPAAFSNAKAHALSARVAYKSLSAAWQAHQIQLPPYKTLQKKLEKAASLTAQLKHETPALQGKISLVAVPPFKVLSSLLDQPTQASGPHFTFADADLLNRIHKSHTWTLLLVIDEAFSQQVLSIRAFIDNDEFRYNDYDCSALGVQELLAAELQGIAIATATGWTLLLKDSVSGENVPCATRQNSGILIDIDDTNGLLGHNYLRPAIRAA